MTVEGLLSCTGRGYHVERLGPPAPRYEGARMEFGSDALRPMADESECRSRAHTHSYDTTPSCGVSPAEFVRFRMIFRPSFQGPSS